MSTEKASAFDAEKGYDGSDTEASTRSSQDLGSYDFLAAHVIHTGCRLTCGSDHLAAMSEIQDDKAQYCIPFILERLEAHHRQHEGEENAPPFFLGLNGVQGAGKTVLVTFFPPLLRSISNHSLHLGLYNPINTPIPAVQPPHHRLLSRRPLPHPRRPSLTRPIPPTQPPPPASRPALNP